MSHKKSKEFLDSSKLVAVGLLESIAAVAYLCVKYTRRASQKIAKSANLNKASSSKWWLAINKKRSGKERFLGEESFGDGAVWRRTILMGDKCQPLEFSGVIYYDCHGNQVFEPPMKSPRGSPFVGYGYPTA